MSEDLFFFCSSPNFGLNLGLNSSEDHFFACRLIWGARHRSSYPLEKFLFEALVIYIYWYWFFVSEPIGCPRPLHLDAEKAVRSKHRLMLYITLFYCFPFAGVTFTAFLHLGVEILGEHLAALNVLHCNHEYGIVEWLMD